MKKKFIAATTILFASTGALAQSTVPANPFEGFSVGIGLSAVGSSTDLSGSRSANIGQQSVVPTIEAAYTQGVSKDVALGFTGTYDLTDTSGGSDGSASIKGKNHYSLNFKPGVVLGSNTMIYGLIGYHHMEGKLNNNASSSTNGFNGIGYGLGLQLLLDKNLYVKLEGQRVRYSSSTLSDLTFEPSKTIATLGVGYKF